MPIIAKDTGGGDFELIPQDNHKARCVMLVDIGTQESNFGPKRQCVIGWELPDVKRVFDDHLGEQPAMVSKFYTLSLSEKANLRRDLESWRGSAFTAVELSGFDLEKLIGVPCLLQVLHKKNAAGEVRAVVGNISRLPKELVVPAQVTESRVFSLDEPNASVFQELPEWIQTQVKNSAEWNGEFAAGDLPAIKTDSATDDNQYSTAIADEVPF